MSKSRTRASRMTNGPPEKHEGFIWFTKEMLCRPNWYKLSVNARRVVERVCIEHLAHAGTENGNLIVTHRDLRAFGISPRHVADAIREAEAFGWIDVNRGQRIAGKQQPSTMALTWQPTAEPRRPATDRWRSVTIADIAAYGIEVKVRRQARKSRNRKTEAAPPFDIVPQPHAVVRLDFRNLAKPPKLVASRQPLSTFPPQPHGGGAFNILGGDRLLHHDPTIEALRQVWSASDISAPISSILSPEKQFRPIARASETVQ